MRDAGGQQTLAGGCAAPPTGIQGLDALEALAKACASYALSHVYMEVTMSTSILTLLIVIPIVFSLVYVLRKSAPKAPTLGHHLLASGSVIHQVHRS